MKTPALIVVLFLGGCAASVTVRAPPCELKPLPAAADKVCEKPTPIADGEMKTLFMELFLANARYDRCIKKFNNYTTQAERRDEDFKKCQGQVEAAQEPKPWWK